MGGTTKSSWSTKTSESGWSTKTGTSSAATPVTRKRETKLMRHMSRTPKTSW